MDLDKKSLHLGVARGTANIWKKAALELGFRIVNGPQMGDGNVAQLLSALAAGDVSSRRLAQALALAREEGQAEAVPVNIHLKS